MHQPIRRPRYLNLLQIRLPPAGLISILHRISGVVMFIALFPVLWLLERSLQSEQGFQSVQSLLQGWPIRLISTLLLWLFIHHLLAGIRVLLIDAEWGVTRDKARRSALIVLFGAVLLSVLGAIL